MSHRMRGFSWILGAGTIALALSAFAQPGPGSGAGEPPRGGPGRQIRMAEKGRRAMGRGPWGAPGPWDSHAVGLHLALHPVVVALDHAEDLDLNDAALAKLERLRMKVRKEGEVRREKFRKAAEAYLKGMHDPKADRSAMEGLAKLVGEAVTEGLTAPLDVRERVEKILTSEQRKKLEEIEVRTPPVEPEAEGPPSE